MGFFSAGDLNAEQATTEYQHVLLDGERIIAAFRTIRDTILLTNLRLLYVNVQGLTGSKVEFQSIPWRSVIRFSIETAGTFDLDADMKIWVSGAAAPIEAKISRRSDPHRIQRLMSEHVLTRR